MARAPSPRNESARGREPWLEEAEPELAEATLIGRGTLWALALALLALVGIVATGLWLVTRKADGPVDIPADGEVPLVQSPGPWRVPASGPGIEGTPVEGQGQLMFPAGEGQAPDGRIDPGRLPEEPVPLAEPGGQEGPPTDLLGPPEVTSWPEPDLPLDPPRPGRRTPEPPAPATAAQPGAAGGLVQLGAFSSERAARRAFADLAARHPELKDVRPEISPVAPGDGRTLWRLRARLEAGTAPGSFCDRLRVAGDACAPVR